MHEERKIIQELEESLLQEGELEAAPCAETSRAATKTFEGAFGNSQDISLSSTLTISDYAAHASGAKSETPMLLSGLWKEALEF